MTIRIERNAAGNCISFIGSTNPVYFNACLSGEVSPSDANVVNVINDIMTAASPTKVYEFFNIPFTEFRDADNAAFADAQACADYITLKANVVGTTASFVLADTDFLDFTIDSTGTTVLVDNGDSFAANSIHAAAGSGGHIDIHKHGTNIDLYQSLRVANASIDGVQVTQTLASAVNELNALFAQSGSSTADPPTITSPLTVGIVTGETLNYELTAAKGVGYEFSSLPSGVVLAEGSQRHILGGASLTAGTYNIGMKAVNYNGEDSETLVLTVASPPYSDTKSVAFERNDFAGSSATPTPLATVLGRTANGAGAGDAWTISFWIKPLDNNASQTVLYLGGDDEATEGRVRVRYDGSNNDEKIHVDYGSDSDYVMLSTPDDSVPLNLWTHVLITYDGGTTGSDVGSLSSYYSRFDIFINGASQTLSTDERNNGWSGAIGAEVFNIGVSADGNNSLRGATRVNEVALWSTDETANAATIYNAGATQDLALLSPAPSNRWRMGDGDTYPTLTDTSGTVDLTMTNMTSSEIVSDVP